MIREFIAQYVNQPPSSPQIPTERLSTLSAEHFIPRSIYTLKRTKQATGGLS